MHHEKQHLNFHDLECSNRSEIQASISLRSKKLNAIADSLKSELFGIDDVIDHVIESMRAWYVFPALISRPVIICLWGMTGTGKTQLTRSLAKKLEYYDRFVEVQMDGFSNGSGFHSSICSMLSDSGIQEAMPGILVLDEFQRFRTIDPLGNDVKVERYQDVWALLSDGRVAPSLSLVRDIEQFLATSHFEQERGNAAVIEPTCSPSHYKLTPQQARQLKRQLKLKEPVMEVMTWGADALQSRLAQLRKGASTWDTDFSKLLIFVCGNLDEMYANIATSVHDCDTDADIFHEQTKRLTVIDVKKALSKRFKPEQISRLGNDHVIYPSFSKNTYEKLIEKTCRSYTDDLFESTGLRTEMDHGVLSYVYENAVFPSQGSRPLFSSIHAILSGPLIKSTLWAIELGSSISNVLRFTVDAVHWNLVVTFGHHQRQFPLRCEISQLKQRNDPNFRAVLAVHEAGHGVLYALLFHKPPQELKINVASFEGGYTSYSPARMMTRQNCLDQVCVSLGGRAAEETVFGLDLVTTGAKSDISSATKMASKFVRMFGFDQRLSLTDYPTQRAEHLNTDLESTNAAIEQLMCEQFTRAKKLLNENESKFLKVVQLLEKHGELSPAELEALIPLQESIDRIGRRSHAYKLADCIR